MNVNTFSVKYFKRKGITLCIVLIEEIKHFISFLFNLCCCCLQPDKWPVLNTLKLFKFLKYLQNYLGGLLEHSMWVLSEAVLILVSPLNILTHPAMWKERFIYVLSWYMLHVPLFTVSHTLLLQTWMCKIPFVTKHNNLHSQHCSELEILNINNRSCQYLPPCLWCSFFWVIFFIMI
jgi:hypothetical protein